jgi:hypothetical protein
MKKAIYAIVLLMAFAVFFSIAATSYFTGTDYLPVGSVVHLFQSGTQEIKKEISVRDTLAVLRPGESCKMDNVGRIEVVSFSGRNYLVGKVISGEILIGDIAQKGTITCLIIPSNWMCKK